MKILILIQCTNLGGMEQCMLLLIEEFAKMNIDSEVVSIAPVGPMGKILEDMGVPVSGGRYKGPFGILSLLEMRRLLKTKKADGLLMIGHNLMAELALGVMYRGKSALALHYHHRGVKPPFVWRLIYRLAARSFNKILFVSDYIMNEALEIEPYIRDKSRMIGTLIREQPILTEKEKAEAKKRMGLNPDAFVIGNAGWLIPRKRWDVFLEVAGKVSALTPQIEFLIAGDGPEREELQLRARRLGIAPKIRWVGWLENLNEFYAAIDTLLFNSDWDAQPRTPLEAMSYGVPVVASILHGGTREIIRNDEEGILLDTHDVQAMVDVLLKLITDHGYRKKLGEAGRARIIDCASPQKNALLTLQAMGITQLKKTPRVASVIVSMVPYHHARWEEFAVSTGLETHLVELTDRDEFNVLKFFRVSTYHRHTLFPERLGVNPWKQKVFPVMMKILDQISPDVLFVSGWGLPVSLAAIAWAVRRGVPLVMLSESNEFDEHRVAWKEYVKHRIVSLCSSGLAGGSPQVDYLVKLGLPRECVFQGYDVIDNAYFEKKTHEVLNSGFRFQVSGFTPSTPYFIACARFAQKKNLPGLIRAYARYRKLLKPSTLDSRPSTSETAGPSAFDLVIAGDGELRAEIEATIRELGLIDHVHLVGGKGYGELPGYYAGAAAFIHASTTEQWGLVVNEAMACGLPVIVSNRCGSATDLVSEGENGWTFDPNDQEQLADLMMKIAGDENLRRRMGRRSREIIAEWGPERFASGAKAAVDAVLASPVKKAGLLDRLILKLLILK